MSPKSHYAFPSNLLSDISVANSPKNCVRFLNEILYRIPVSRALSSILRRWSCWAKPVSSRNNWGLNRNGKVPKQQWVNVYRGISCKIPPPPLCAQRPDSGPGGPDRRGGFLHDLEFGAGGRRIRRDFGDSLRIP